MTRARLSRALFVSVLLFLLFDTHNDRGDDRTDTKKCQGRIQPPFPVGKHETESGPVCTSDDVHTVYCNDCKSNGYQQKYNATYKQRNHKNLLFHRRSLLFKFAIIYEIIISNNQHESQAANRVLQEEGPVSWIDNFCQLSGKDDFLQPTTLT